MSQETAPRKPRLLFCSYHSYLDPSSGAALATRDLLELLAAHGWQCAVLSGPELDFEQAASFEAVLRAQDLPFQFRPGTVLETPCTLYHWVLGGVPVHAFVPTAAGPRRPPTKEEGRAFLSLLDHVQQRFRPDLLLTYGGQWVAHPLIRRAKAKGVKVVFALHNLDYDGTDLFREVDAILVPSHAAQEHYRQKFGLTSTAIPGPWNWDRVLCSRVNGRYVTFVNPQPGKGAFWFARVAAELGRRRPDIPLLVVEGRGQADWLARCGLDLSGLTNLHGMANTPDPRQFYAVSKAVLMPSLWQEALGRVAVEALINGIPVLASRRGGLPEALAGAGCLFDIPQQYTPQTRQAPTAEEVAPWVETIERLWDDPAFYAAESGRCRQAAEAWRPERLWPRFEEFFLRVLQPSA
jgi:glycosyltransferase involved in cell wall biosynthesis